MTLKNLLISNTPREESGSDTARKYSFQNDVSLFLLISRFHLDENNYVFLFDFHDDLAVLDNNENPSEIDFFQIKSKDRGNWTTANLIKKEKKDNLSLVGKLYSNKIKFREYVRSLNIISNATFNVKLAEPKKNSILLEKIRLSNLSKSEITKIEKVLKEEFKIENVSDFKDLTILEVTKVSNKDSMSHLVGYLGELIHSINPNSNVNSALAYRQISNEIKRKAEQKTSNKSISTFEDIIGIKGISKLDFLTLLKNAGLYKSTETEWAEIVQLIAPYFNFQEIKKLKLEWNNLAAKEITLSNNLAFLQLNKKISEKIENIEMGDLNLKQIVDKIYAEIINTDLFEEFFVKAIIIKKLYE